MKRLPILILYLVIPCLAQVFAADEPATRTYPLKYVKAEEVRKLFSNLSYPIRANRDFNVLTVTAPAGFQSQVEAVVKQFDVAPPIPDNIELAVYLISDAATTTPAALPKELADVYKNFHLTDSQVIRTRTGCPAEASGAALLVRLLASSVGKEAKGSVISIDGLRVQVKAPEGVLVTADVDLRENQPSTIGKAGAAGLVVVVAKIIP